MEKSIWKTALALILICILTGCGSMDERAGGTTEDGVQQQYETAAPPVANEAIQKEVVFLNYIPNGLETDDVVGVRSAYGEYDGDKDTLYAYAVNIIPLTDHEKDPPEQPEDYPEKQPEESEEAWRMRRDIFLAEKAVEVMESMGVTVLYDHPLCAYGKRNLELEAYYSPENWGYEHCVVIGTEDEIANVFGKWGLETEGYLLRAKSAPRPETLEVLKEKGWDFQLDFSEKEPGAYAPYLGSDLYVVQTVTLQ